MRMKRKNVMLRKTMSGLTVLAMGGSAFQLSGCDANTRSLVLAGLEAASTGLLVGLADALFIGLDLAGRPETIGDGTTTSGSGL